MHLFVENFLVPIEEPDRLPPEPIYDEARELNLDPDGRVFVEHALTGGETHTLTEVRGEYEDRDPDDDLVARTETITKVRGERPEILGELDLGTRTAVPREAEDYLAGESLMGTETAVGGEPSDYRNEIWEGTQTFVRGEKEDFSRELLEAERPLGFKRDR